jgi:hypothetical protein
MVKTKASLVLFCAALLAGCGASGSLFSLPPEQLAIPAGAPGRFLSLGISGGELCAVFSDAESTTLKLLRVPLGPHLPQAAPAASVIDRIDIAPPLSPTFGAHVLSATDNAISVLYLVRQGEDKSVLKLATKARDAENWTLDIVEPAGDPVAILPSDKGSLSLFWSAGSLLTRGYPDASPALSLVGGFLSSGRASVLGPAGFTAFDGASRRLLQVSRGGAGFETRIIPGGTAVQSSMLLPDGRLAVLSWDAAARRLLLLEDQREGDAMTRTTVTLCDETAAVALLPSRDGYLFLFDESRRGGGGGPRHALSLIARQGVRYRKTVLLSGPERIEGFAAVKVDDALYVIAVQGGVKLLRAAVPQ